MQKVKTDNEAILIFMKEYQDKKKKESIKNNSNKFREDKKLLKLASIISFLDECVKNKLVVQSNRLSNITAPKAYVDKTDTVPFSFYRADSSPSWKPGVSVFFDHPIQTEIAIPNDYDVTTDGAVIIRTSGYHKDVDMFKKKFKTMEEARSALALFLGRNAIKIDMPAKKNKPIMQDKEIKQILEKESNIAEKKLNEQE